MKIGIDARFLTHPQVGGFKTYTSNLINALSQVDNENQYLLYIDRPPSDCVLPKSENFSYHVVPFTIPGFGMPYREQVVLRRQIEHDKPDIMHFLSNTATIGLNRKFVITLHDTIQVSNPYTWHFPTRLSSNKIWAITIYSKWAILRTAQKAVSIITVSNFEKDQIIGDLSISPERIFVTHLAPNPIFKPASEEAKKAWRKDIVKKHGIRRPFVLGIGHEPRKRIPQLINAFSNIELDHPELDLVIVSASEKTRLMFQETANKLDIGNRVIILPGLPQKELVVLLNLAEIFVYPSERESFGLPPLEAMACGTPVVAAISSSIPEIVGPAALLVNGAEVKDIATGIDQILNYESIKAKLISSGLDHAAKFSWKRCALQTIDIYKQAYKQRLIEHNTIKSNFN